MPCGNWVEMEFFCSNSNFLENGTLDNLNSKSFARILDHELSQFVGIIDSQSRSLDSIAYFEDHKENFWRGRQSRTRWILLIAKNVLERSLIAQQNVLSIAKKLKILFICTSWKMSMTSVREGRTTAICR